MEKLFCLPYAGGSSLMYYKWRRLFGPQVQVIPLEYPGHGRRMGEPLCASLEETVADLRTFLLQNAGSEPFSLVGYSLGSALAYELALELQNHSLLGPRLRSVILCACPAPHQPEQLVDDRALSEEDWMQYLLDLGGTRANSPGDLEALRQFLPLARNDFGLYRQFKLRHSNCPPQPLTVPAAIFYSEEEAGHIRRWDDCCAGGVFYRSFPGGHFFLNQPGCPLPQQIGQFLERVYSDGVVL